MTKKNLGTLCVQAGYEPKNGEPRVVPIVQSTTFKYDSSEQIGKSFWPKRSRIFLYKTCQPNKWCSGK